MAQLSSPGVSVSVIDESFYTPAAPGTVPLIIVATAENKANGAGTGTAPGTLKANAGKTYLITSQKDLIDTYGNPVFKTDANNNPVHAGEQNEYGLQAAYSLLGVSNRAYVVRADIDLSTLNGSATAPAADPSNGTYWLDTDNTAYGIFEWDGGAKSATGTGQTFIAKTPIVITDTSKVVSYSDVATTTPFPKASIGAIGDYAVVSLSDLNTDYTAPDTVFYKNKSGAWVKVGSNDWAKSWSAVTGTAVNPTLAGAGETFTLNGQTITNNSETVAGFAELINSNSNLSDAGVSAAAVNGKLEIYSEGLLSTDTEDSSASSPITFANGTGTWSTLGIAVGTYYGPQLAIQAHTQIPAFKKTDNAGQVSGFSARPTGSVWVKTTEPNAGARFRVKRYNSATDSFEAVSAPLYANGQSAIYALDKAGGGLNIAAGAVYVKTNSFEDNGSDTTPRTADYKIFRKISTGATIIKSDKITTQVTAGSKAFTIQESITAQSALNAKVTVSFTALGTIGDADLMAAAINSAGFTNIVADVDAQNRVVISHTKGGEFRLADGTGTPLSLAGFTAFNNITQQGTANLYTAPAADANDFIASLWEPLAFSAGGTAPSSLTVDGTLWYNSIVDEVDMLVHDGETWVGYQSATSPFYASSSTDKTDPEGPIVAATEPETQSDGTALKNGDLWIDTSDTENYPVIYKYDGSLLKWILVNKADQSTEDGVLFADARYNTSGVNSDEAGLIVDLLTSDYLDPDAPDPALYPKGMLLWNLRRSGFNVKKFVRNSIDVNADNTRMNNVSMADYYPHRWVSEAGNQEDGSGTFGRKAQRKVIVQALQALTNSNQEIREEEQRVFNLIACPGYPELIGEMITLNYDRGLTAFVVGDTPARLTSDATSLSNWGNNAALALEDNDLGAASFDEYMAMFYPWGYTSDNFGNNVVVPPSHMMLRTIALSDNVSYPWFAPAGTRRGGITNATAVGYIDSEGEFRAVALNNGQRDTLYDVKVNPITFLTGVGLVNYGQKTRARNASALDRINVARLVIYLRRQLGILAKPYIFEPNDKITRDEIKTAVESLMLELVGQRALYDYIVVCDESNNTPSRIDRNELYVDVAIEPVKAVEFIYIPLRLKNTGEIAGL